MEFDLQTYLSEMEKRSMARFDAIDERLQDIPDLKTRVALLEQTSGVLGRGLWTVFITSFGAALGWLFSFFKHS